MLFAFLISESSFAKIFTVNICDSETLQIEYCRILNLSFSIFQGCFSTLQCNVAQIHILSSILRVCVMTVCNQLWNGPQSLLFLHTAGAKVSKASSHMNNASRNSPSICIVDRKILMFPGNQYWFLMFFVDFNYLQICELQIVLNVETNWLSFYLITHPGQGQFLFFHMGYFVVKSGCFLFPFFLLYFAISIYITYIKRYAHSQRAYLDIFDILFCYLLLKWLIK